MATQCPFVKKVNESATIHFSLSEGAFENTSVINATILNLVKKEGTFSGSDLGSRLMRSGNPLQTSYEWHQGHTFKEIHLSLSSGDVDKEISGDRNAMLRKFNHIKHNSHPYFEIIGPILKIT